jgi:hypothetical protein
MSYGVSPIIAACSAGSPVRATFARTMSGSGLDLSASSVEVMYSVWSGATSATTYLLSYLIPTLLGNIIGGVALVSALNRAQVISGKRNSSPVVNHPMLPPTSLQPRKR